MLLFWGGGCLMARLIAIGGRVFFSLPGGNRVAVRGGVKQALTCGLRVETEQATFRGGPCRLPGR